MADAKVQGYDPDYGTADPGPQLVTAAVAGYDPDLGQAIFARAGTDPIFIAPANTGSGYFDDEAALPSAGTEEGDWAKIAGDGEQSQTHYGVRQDAAAAWEVAQRFEQGPTLSGANSGFRTELDAEGYSIRYWDGTGDEPGKEWPFAVDDQGVVYARGMEIWNDNSDDTVWGTTVKPGNETAANTPLLSRWTDNAGNLLAAIASGGSRLFAAEIGSPANQAITLSLREIAGSMATPGTNFLRIYVKAKGGTNALYAKTDDGTEHELTGWAADAILKTFMAAKGDIITASANDTPTILSVGADGTTLTADAAAANGVKWGPPTRSLAVVVGAANVAASLTAINMVTVGQGGSTIAGRFVMPWAGALVGVSTSANEARVGGTCTVEVYLNGVATGLTAVLNGTNTTHASGTQAMTADTFSAGDYLEIKLTTTAGWLPITADVSAQAWVQWTA